jgi:subtilase family serine protease
MDSLDRIRDVNYVPTPQDMIMAYVPTIGIQNVIFTTNNQTFQYGNART